MQQVFDGVRVLEFGQGMAVPMAGMVLADYGAEVIKVEPPGGDWARPLLGFQMWNRGKRSVVLDLRSDEGKARARRLLGSADVVLDDISGGLAGVLGAGGADLLQREVDRSLVHCAVSGFGQASAYSTLDGYEGIVAATCGRVNGNDRLSGLSDDTDRGEPIHVAAPIGSFGAAMLTVTGVVSALVDRLTTGQGWQLETSVLDGIMATTMRLGYQRNGSDIVRSLKPAGTDLVRLGVELCFLVVECSDGRFIQMCARMPEHFRNWMTAIGLDHVLGDPRYARLPLGLQDPDDARRMESLIREAMSTRTQAEWMRRFTEEFDVGADPFLTPSEYLSDTDMTSNERVLTLGTPGLGPVRQVGPLAILSATPGEVVEPAPALGADQELADADHPPRAVVAPRPDRAERRLPLTGRTIVEAAYFIAAPLGSAILAGLGARVLKLEPLTGDPYRYVGVEFATTVHGKESLAIDLKDEQAPGIVARLVEGADVFVQSFRPGVADRLGLGEADLRSRNDRLVYVNATSYGLRGPSSARPAFHPMPNALTGGGAVQAGAGNRPVDDSYPDPCAALAVAAATATALYAQARYGIGQQVETSMLATGGYVQSPMLVQVEGTERGDYFPSDPGQHGQGAFYRLYECLDGWVFLAAVTREQESAVLGFLDVGNPATGDVDAPLGLRRDEGLENTMGKALGARTVLEVRTGLGERGVPVTAVSDASFEEFVATNIPLEPASHPALGDYFRLPNFVRPRDVVLPPRPACAAGEHSRAILSEFGVTAEDVQRLEDHDVVRQWSDPQ